MLKTRLDRVILGHNQFFGVDHLSQDKGNEKYKKFGEIENVIGFLRQCDNLGIKNMMMSTHPNAGGIVREMSNDKSLSEWKLYPLVPYINKYVRMANEKGMINMGMEILMKTSLSQKFRIFMAGGSNLFVEDVRKALTVLLDIELADFRKMNLGGVFLHDALTDMAVGLNLDSALLTFKEHVEKHYGVPAGLVTKNAPSLITKLDELNWANPLIMSSFNKSEFYVNPSNEALINSIESKQCDFVAMNTLASGHLNPEDAYAYLSKFNFVNSVVVGFSRLNHATETIEAINRNLI